jgi:glucose/arabinose dehydrogenase
MLKKLFVLVFISVAGLLAGCGSESSATRVFRPTNTPVTPSAVPDVNRTSASPKTPTASAVAAVGPTGEGTTAMLPTPSTVEPSPTPAATHTGTPQPPPSPTSLAQPSLSPSPTQPFPPAIALEPVLGGFRDPTYLTFASQASPWDDRLFVVEKGGRILLVEAGQVRETPFLDIRDRVGSGSSEQGLLSLAFPPDFVTSAVFYVDYTDLDGNTVVARYRLGQQDPPVADPASEQVLLQIDQPAANHNGGQLQFGPGGYLYIGVGDGGRAGDPWGNAQNPDVLLGKLLRIDVAGGDAYRIPPDNPFVDQSNVRPEIWALGLRNPWRFSFDALTQDLYIADVGQNTYEEVDFQPSGSGGGGNYGWDVMEGRHCFEPASGCDTTGLVLPVAEYDHSLGCSVTGGYVYRGSRYPALDGVYFFGDYCSGRIWGLRRQDGGDWQMALLLETGVTISSFGADAGEELYVLGYGDGMLYRLTAQP